MKTYSLIFSVLFALILSLPTATLAQAQSNIPTPVDTLITKANIKNNTVFWHQDKLVEHVDGKLYAVQDTIWYSNGTMVFADGTLRLPDGKSMSLKQKHAISPQGRVVLVADDIFTYDTIIEHEREVVGDTETRIIVIEGKLASVATGKEKQVFSIGHEKRIQLLEEMVKLLEQRAQVLEKSLTASERKSIDVYYNGLNKRILNVENQLKALTPSVK